MFIQLRREGATGMGLAACLLTFLGCSPQTSDKGTISVKNREQGSVSTQGGEVGIDDGSKVTFPPGALAIDAEVVVEKVAQPSEFAVSASAGSPVAIRATTSSGTPIDTVAVPMTVNLVLDDSALLGLTTTGNVEDLCVLLKTRLDSLFVWRRAAIDFDATARVAKVQSTNLGTFQLVYCGKAALPGFQDAVIAGLSNESKAQATMRVATGFAAGVAASQYCLVLIQEKKSECPSGGSCDDERAALAVTQAQTTDTNPVLTLSYVVSAVKEDFDKKLILLLMDGPQGCPFKAGEDLAKVEEIIGLKALYGFDISTNQVTSGVDGDLGADGIYKLTNRTVSVGGPGEAGTYATFDEAELCLSGEVEGVGMTSRGTQILGGKLGGVPDFEVPFAVGAANAGVRSRLSVRVGQGCHRFDTGVGDPTTGKPYELRWTGEPPYYLTPVKLSVTVSNTLLMGKTGCLDVFPAGGTEPVAGFTVGLTTRDYQVYLPYLGGTLDQATGKPVYDLKMTILDEGATCRDVKSSLPPYTSKNRILNPVISLQI